MKRATRKLSLARETLQLLSVDLVQAKGGLTAMPNCNSTLGPPTSALTNCTTCP